MLSHVERHPVSCLLASLTGLAGGALNYLHVVQGIFAFVSTALGAVITTVTFVGMVRTWLKNRRIRNAIIAPAAAPRLD